MLYSLAYLPSDARVVRTFLKTSGYAIILTSFQITPCNVSLVKQNNEPAQRKIVPLHIPDFICISSLFNTIQL